MGETGPYNEEVRRRFANPVHAGDPSGDHDRILQAAASESAHGARLVLYAGLRDGKIASLRFRAKGCPHLIAAAELFCSSYAGLEPVQLLQVSIAGSFEILEVPVEKTGRLLLIEDAARELARDSVECSPEK